LDIPNCCTVGNREEGKPIGEGGGHPKKAFKFREKRTQNQNKRGVPAPRSGIKKKGKKGGCSNCPESSLGMKKRKTHGELGRSDKLTKTKKIKALIYGKGRTKALLTGEVLATGTAQTK